MESLYLLLSYIDQIFINSLFISVLSILIAGNISHTNIREPLAIVRWLMFSYAILNTNDYLIAYFSASNYLSFSTETTGSYGFLPIYLFIAGRILPLVLLFNRPGRSPYILLGLSLLMNAGWLFEFLKLFSTERQNQTLTQLLINFLLFFLLKGVFIGALIYSIGRLIKKRSLIQNQ
ncbi:hypothetical protein [Pedobacter sp. GR22-6]|uniref:hypothetical protein n=1 Tax=Pedobacter sp. GR22-6 TaxID=3127957 RepID=UPI00307F2D28